MVVRGRVREAWRYGAVVEPPAGAQVGAPEDLTQGRSIEHTGETRLSAGESATDQVSEYESTAELREALTSDQADRRATAYGDVFEAGLQPQAVLSDEPPETELAEAGLVPTARDQRTRNDRLEDILAELQYIREAIQEGGG